MKDSESFLEFFERKSQTNIRFRFIKVGEGGEGRYSVTVFAYVRKKGAGNVHVTCAHRGEGVGSIEK